VVVVTAVVGNSAKEEKGFLKGTKSLLTLA